MFLAMADADRVQDYIFHPPKLKLIRGASRLQAEAVDELARTIEGPNRRVSAAGGVVIAALESEARVRAFQRDAERIWSRLMGAASVTSAAVPYTGAFERALEAVQDAIEVKKRSNSKLAFNVGGPLWVQCEHCGESEATRTRKYEGAELAVCRSCHLKGRRNQQLRRADLDRPRDFEQLGRLADPSNYMGVVFIDIDQMGRYFKKHAYDRREELFQQASEGLEGAMQTAHATAAASIPFAIDPKDRRRNPKPIAPYEKLYGGGDDLMVVTAGQHSFEYLIRFTEAFDQAAAWSKYRKPTLSAGVVIAHSHFPIAEFAGLARKLARSAKRIEGEHSIHFKVWSSPTLDSAKSGVVHGSSVLPDEARTANPYTVTAFKQLIADIGVLKSPKPPETAAPKSKINSLYKMAWSGPMAADLEYLNLLTRLERPHADAVKRAIGGASLWDIQNGAYRTRAADLVEAWEFVNV